MNYLKILLYFSFIFLNAIPLVANDNCDPDDLLEGMGVGKSQNAAKSFNDLFEEYSKRFPSELEKLRKFTNSLSRSHEDLWILEVQKKLDFPAEELAKILKLEEKVNDGNPLLAHTDLNLYRAKYTKELEHLVLTQSDSSKRLLTRDEIDWLFDSHFLGAKKAKGHYDNTTVGYEILSPMILKLDTDIESLLLLRREIDHIVRLNSEKFPLGCYSSECKKLALLELEKRGLLNDYTRFYVYDNAFDNKSYLDKEIYLEMNTAERKSFLEEKFDKILSKKQIEGVLTLDEDLASAYPKGCGKECSELAEAELEELGVAFDHAQGLIKVFAIGDKPSEKLINGKFLRTLTLDQAVGNKKIPIRFLRGNDLLEVLPRETLDKVITEVQKSKTFKGAKERKNTNTVEGAFKAQVKLSLAEADKIFISSSPKRTILEDYIVKLAADKRDVFLKSLERSLKKFKKKNDENAKVVDNLLSNLNQWAIQHHRRILTKTDSNFKSEEYLGRLKQKITDIYGEKIPKDKLEQIFVEVEKLNDELLSLNKNKVKGQFEKENVQLTLNIEGKYKDNELNEDLVNRFLITNKLSYESQAGSTNLNSLPIGNSLSESKVVYAPELQALVKDNISSHDAIRIQNKVLESLEQQFSSQVKVDFNKRNPWRRQYYVEDIPNSTSLIIKLENGKAMKLNVKLSDGTVRKDFYEDKPPEYTVNTIEVQSMEIYNGKPHDFYLPKLYQGNSAYKDLLKKHVVDVRKHISCKGKPIPSPGKITTVMAVDCGKCRGPECQAKLKEYFLDVFDKVEEQLRHNSGQSCENCSMIIEHPNTKEPINTIAKLCKDNQGCKVEGKTVPYGAMISIYWDKNNISNMISEVN